MKAGIITLQDVYNYGNRLQNYAVSEIIKNCGMEVDTVIIKNREYFFTNGRNKSVKGVIKRLLPMRSLSFFIEFRDKMSRNKADNSRARNFREFNRKYIPMKMYYANRTEELLQNRKLQEYDFFFVGSDQVWNPDWAGGDLFFLTFVPSEKRVACIASMGVTEFPAEQVERYARLLNQMKYISVREETAAHIIKGLTGQDVDCFFDPVLLLGRDEWLKIEESPSFSLPHRYVLSFFLGMEPKGEVERFARRKKAVAVHMNQKDNKYYSLGPTQFLHMVRNAEYVLTDSFHVAAFSIIFQKQFSVFRRRQKGMEKENMFSRIETLLGRLELMKRVQDASVIEDINDISKTQWLAVERALAVERIRLDKTMQRILRGFV